MVNALNTTLRLFADDFCLLLSSKNPHDLQELRNSELSHLKTWMDANKLTVKPAKSICIIVIPKLRDPHTCLSLCYNHSQINGCNFLKYLGIELYKQLSFLPHISKTKLKLSSNVGILTN